MREEHLPSSLSSLGFRTVILMNQGKSSSPQPSFGVTSFLQLFGQAGDSISCDGSGQGRPWFS